MRINHRIIFAVILLLIVSILLGFSVNGISTLIDKKSYPNDIYSDEIESEAEAFLLPKEVVYGLVSYESGFSAEKKDGDKIGLLQLDETMLKTAYEFLDEPYPGTELLYNPSFNLHAGCAYISYLYNKYYAWDGVYLAFLVGESRTDEMISAMEGDISDQITDKDLAKALEQINEIVQKYKELYGEKIGWNNIDT